MQLACEARGSALRISGDRTEQFIVNSLVYLVFIKIDPLALMGRYPMQPLLNCTY